MKKLDIGKKPLISQIIFMCVYFYYVYYLQKNKCECIDSNRNHLIQKLYMLQLILMLVITYSNFNINLYIILLTLNVVVTLYIIFNIRQFIVYIEKNDCECSQTFVKTIIKYCNIFNIIIIFYLLIEIIYNIMIFINMKIHN